MSFASELDVPVHCQNWYGYTKLLDGTVIESIANRLLTFPTNMPHTSSTCNDKQIRSNININYYK